MRIAIDMDEVLADTHAAKAALYADLGWSWPDADLRGRKLGDLAPDAVEAAVEAEMQKGMFFANVAPMPGAAAAVERLAARHEVFVATAAMEYPASCAHKVAWMARHLPAIDPLNLVLCGDKSIIAADVLIDDSPRHFDGFGGIGVCFDALHNHGADVAWRLSSWDAAPDLMDHIAAEEMQ